MRLLGFILLAAATAHADYTVDWSSMDAGGGSGVVGTFAMRGTIGQLDATSGAPSNIVFLGGYWSLVDDPIPLLRIFEFKGAMVLAWPDPSPGFVLQATPDLAPPDWEEVAITPEIVEGEKQVIWGPPNGRYFFRLRRP